MAYTAYDLLDNLKSTSTGAAGESDYSTILNRVRDQIVQKHSAKLIESLRSENAGSQLKGLILHYLSQDDLGDHSITELTERIYQDMAGLGILEKYIRDPEVEEININGWNGIDIVYSDRAEVVKESFTSPEAAVDIIKKMMRMGNFIIDGAHPVGDSYIGDGIRISAMIPPCIDPKIGVVASIRKQNIKFKDRDELIRLGTASAEELDFLTLCLVNDISIGIGGGTNSGKTNDINFLAKEYIKVTRNQYRIFTIEETRELDLIEYKDNYMTSRVVHAIVKGEPNPVTASDLLRTALRFHPKMIIPGEMRGAEAMLTVEAGRTGHVILSSLHANNAVSAYKRILTMCYMANTDLSESVLLDMIIEAFPIMAYKEQLKDGSRKYLQIFEATGHKDGRVTGNYIFRYIPKQVIKDETGKIIEYIGEHRQVGYISKELADRLYMSGADIEDIKKYAGPEWEPEE